MSNQASGRLAGEKKWLVTRYPKPPGKLIFLGSILTNPEEPETSLNRVTGVLDVPEQDTIDDSAAVRQQIHSELSSNVGALLRVVPPTSLLFSAGMKAEGRSSNEISTTVEAMNVSAKSFIPGKSYMDEALKAPEITRFLKGCAWSRSLYMIVGVATAEALGVAEEQSQEKTIVVSANASLDGTGMELAGELSHGTTASSGSRMDTMHATDFAYRVREFKYMKFSKKVKDKGDRTEGTMFGREGRNSADRRDKVYVPVFEDWVARDKEVDAVFVLHT